MNAGNGIVGYRCLCGGLIKVAGEPTYPGDPDPRWASVQSAVVTHHPPTDDQACLHTMEQLRSVEWVRLNETTP